MDMYTNIMSISNRGFLTFKFFRKNRNVILNETVDGCVHPNGWGTILVGGMRFGGAPELVKSEDGTKAYPFISSYFILDITDPERSPTLLGELTDEFTDPM